MKSNKIIIRAKAKRLFPKLALTERDFKFLDNMGFEKIDLSTLSEIRLNLRQYDNTFIFDPIDYRHSLV